MGFLMTGGIMTVAAAYLWKRRRKTEGGKIAVMLFALVLSIPHHSRRVAGENLAGIPRHPAAVRTNSALMFVNWGHQKLEPHGGIPAIIKNTYNNIYGRLGRTGKAPQP